VGRTTDFPRTANRLYAALLTCGVVFVEYYTGPFSPVPVVITFGVFHFGQSNDRFLWLYLASVVIVSYIALASLTAFGIVEDRGLFNAVSTDLGARVFAIIAAGSVLGVTLRLARVSRSALRDAIVRSNEALIVAQRREAQLAEAHHQLDRALQLAVGKPGRYTGSFAGDFELGLVIGIGAIGEVYSAVRAADGVEVAVKLLQTTALQRGDLVERILREGMITSSLDSPYLVRVFDVGRMDDGAPYITMERLQGRDLGARLRQDGLLALQEVARLAEHLGTGLQHAHDAEIIHRDLKPLNIFEAQAPEGATWKILDFGISKLASSSGTLTQEGVVGTPGYMSPEQARGVTLDARSDVFSMAVVLYRALTGQPAFPGESTPQVMFDVVYKVPRQPTSVVSGIPSDLDHVMAIGMAKSPEQRFQSARELAAAFSSATRRALSPELRARGQALARQAPWGSMLAQRSEDGDSRS
jgi:serine/threonine-protein kinase